MSENIDRGGIVVSQANEGDIFETTKQAQLGSYEITVPINRQHNNTPVTEFGKESVLHLKHHSHLQRDYRC